MERIEYRNVIDKADWARGEWDGEPDKVQWQDEETGLPCLIVRGPSGSLCGYVGVSEGHPLFGVDYDDCNLEVHGGLTFAKACSPGVPEDRGICHKPAPGEPDHVWWLGFDCAHAFDLTPAARGPVTARFLPLKGDIYRNVAYVTHECQRLARQLKHHGA